MDELEKKLHDKYKETAEIGLDRMIEAMNYFGEDQAYFVRGKLGYGAAANYVRLRATETNRLAVRLMAERQRHELPAGPTE